MNYKIKEEVLEKVLNYLASKPFIEVHALISELQKVEKIEEKIEEKKEE